IRAFTYLPRQDGTTSGMTDRYIFEVSLDGKKWKKVAEGEFGNLRANPIEQTITFPPEKARYFRFTGTHALDKNHVSAAEIGVLE
ncbi:MAG: discoidin domain-containing protein, partial [Opitutales bacterium]|nr:discoidin domain-containing protein [Opitutales bacterium]